MRKIFAVSILVVLIFSAAAAVHADDPIKKLGRGIANIVSSPFEIPHGIGNASEEKGMLAGFTWGVLKGTFDFGRRAVVGGYEIVTFLLPFPAEYEPVLEDPEFFLQKD